MYKTMKQSHKYGDIMYAIVNRHETCESIASLHVTTFTLVCRKKVPV